jgi:hypothetical protein
VFNFLHCPDDAEAAAIELAYLVGPPAAAAMRALAEAEAEPAHAGLLGVAQLRAALPVLAGPDALGFPAVANRIRQRLVLHLAAEAGGEPTRLAALAEARAGLEREAAAIADEPSAAGRLARAQAAHPAIHAALVAGAGADPGIREGLAALAALYDVAGTRRLGPILALADRGVYLAEVERVALDAHRRSFWRASDPEVELDG